MLIKLSNYGTVAIAPHPGAVVAKKVRSGSLTLTWVGIVPVVP